MQEAAFGVNGATSITNMSKDDKVITRGRFKGKKITFASTERIEEFTQLAGDFMGQVFDLEAGEYLISDESDVRDFTEMGSSDTAEIWRRITEIYGVSPADVGSGRLVSIFAEIARRRNMLEPVWKHLTGSCHLTRRTEAAITAAGFNIERIERESIRKVPPIVRPSIRGIARKAG